MFEEMPVHGGDAQALLEGLRGVFAVGQRFEKRYEEQQGRVVSLAEIGGNVYAVV